MENEIGIDGTCRGDHTSNAGEDGTSRCSGCDDLNLDPVSRKFRPSFRRVLIYDPAHPLLVFLFLSLFPSSVLHPPLASPFPPS